MLLIIWVPQNIWSCMRLLNHLGELKLCVWFVQFRKLPQKFRKRLMIIPQVILPCTKRGT